MLRKFLCLASFGACLLAARGGRAQTAVLLAVGDATQLSEMQLAKVMANDSSLWLSVGLQGRTRLALVIAEAAVETAPGAHAWLRALDFATRVRVAAPPRARPDCEATTPFELADSGLPEPRRVVPLEVASADSELELRRRLADAELPVDVERVAQLASAVPPPFRIVIYDVPAFGGRTEALRLIERGAAGELPRIVLSGASSLPLSLIALAKDGVLPLEQDSADPSEFPVTYRALDQSSDYLWARGGWLAQNPTRWLNEVQASSALFAWSVLSANAQVAPVVSRYFEALSEAHAGACEVRVQAAHDRGSADAAEFECNGADDLALSLTEIDFAQPRLSRFWGMAGVAENSFRVTPSPLRSQLLQATDLDGRECPPTVPVVPNTPGEPREFRKPPVRTPRVVIEVPADPPLAPTPVPEPVARSEGSCTVNVFESGDGSDSCSGDSSSGDSSADSCSGDSSSDDSGPDSCAGDSSDSGSESCSGDSESDGDSSGCGKSEYDGDTCSGDAESADRAKSATLRAGSAAARPRPRQVRLSLLTLLAAAVALPLRRLRASR